MQCLDNGELKGYFLSTYSAKKLKMLSTGNSGGAHNLLVQSSNVTLDELLVRMDRGLFITDLLGHGTNMVTGDYSRGASGFWVEDGKIIHSVEGITIAGNLKDMYKNIRLIANDIYKNSSRYVGSMLIDNITVGSEK